ncbi:hypothetical protein KW798_02025 [Candidatus Parcubacteria bacterium]|nr:hypothetical protein [Candidatus Parcubacteria bacterium]
MKKLFSGCVLAALGLVGWHTLQDKATAKEPLIAQGDSNIMCTQSTEDEVLFVGCGGFF